MGFRSYGRSVDAAYDKYRTRAGDKRSWQGRDAAPRVKRKIYCHMNPTSKVGEFSFALAIDVELTALMRMQSAAKAIKLAIPSAHLGASTETRDGDGATLDVKIAHVASMSVDEIAALAATYTATLRCCLDEAITGQ